MITPDVPLERVIEIATSAVRGGADVVQLRQKTMPRGELLELARELRGRLGQALFVVNDYVDIALLSGADGVHLGPDDMTVTSARKVAGDRLLYGVSASTPDAVQPGADYVGCGPAFSTPVKPEKQVVGPAGVAAMVATVNVPVFANPQGNVTSATFGQITGIAGGTALTNAAYIERQVKVGLRFTF